MADIRDRNLGIRKVRVADLEDAPWNFRTHPQAQQEALAGIVNELGWYGYPDVYQTDDGVLRIADGHLRKAVLLEKYGPDAEIEVNVTDFNEDEAKKATLTKDPLAAMAESDAAQLKALLNEVQTGEQAVADMLGALAEQNGIVPGEQAETVLKKLDMKPPPKMTWVLLGIPTVRFGEIAQHVEALAKVPETICETTSNDG